MLMDARTGRPDHVYLSDFGLSKGMLAATGLTRTGQFLGTLDYIAPEQLEGHEVDGRADEYALACAAFELLAGAPPFQRDEAMAVMHAQVSEPPPPLTSRRPDLPSAADRVLARALAKAPADRYATCRQFADALRGALGLPSYAQVPGEAGRQPGGPDRQADNQTVIRPGAGPGGDGQPDAGPGHPGPGLVRGMRELPTGTVTMLFSYTEESTALLSRLGDRYGEAMSAQRALLRDAFDSCRGRDLGTEGDSFFVVFESAGDAVSCCLAGQRALAAHDWPDGVRVRVRMGLHSGEPARHEEGYVGLEVHRAARIAAAAHGGQVVLSDATRHLAESRLPASMSLRDLGWHRLKDIEAPERIYQLVVPGLQEQFPPLRSLGAWTSFPVPMTPLVGRDAELAALRATVARPDVRLVTLTGPGGAGKTRLALAAAASLHEAFGHGGYFVPLAPVHDCEVMWKTIAGSLDVTGDGPDSDVVTGYLRDRRALLVLDNLEQLDGAASVAAAVLAAAPELVILATSRRPLHVVGEHELPVPPLAIPAGGSAAEVAACGAAMLFAQQAQMVRPGFAITEGNAADVAAICARLDGLPLAIELAAARVKLLTPRALRGRLGQGLALAAADAGRPQRQQTLRDTIAWSYELLSPALAEVFRRASVFVGGCGLDALAAVAVEGSAAGPGADPLELTAELQDGSLVTVTEGADGEPRLGMLETIRDYALARLAEAGELEETRRRHAAHYAGFAEAAGGQPGRPVQLAGLDRLEAEHDNLRAALSWSLDPGAADAAADGERAATGMRLARVLIRFWHQRGHVAEGRRWLQRAIDLAAEDAGAPWARLAHGLGILLATQGEHAKAVELFERALAIWRELGDREQQAVALNNLGMTRLYRGELAAARSLLEESITIAREIGSDSRLATALASLGQVENAAGKYDRAAQVLHEALALDQKQGDPRGEAIDQQSLAEISLRAGRIQEARELLAGMLDYATGSGDTEFLANALEVAACIDVDLGDCPRAACMASAADRLRQQTGVPRPAHDEALLERFLAPARAATQSGVWDANMAAGLALTQQQAADLLRSAAQRT
jgi:predicted ATPase/class 3 adenylate cyclase